MNTNKSHDAILSVLTPWFPLTASEIHECAPKVRRVAYQIGQLEARGRIHCCGLRHTMERGSERLYLPAHSHYSDNQQLQCKSVENSELRKS